MLANLRRITRDGRWIPEIDSLRFVAIFSVFLFHLNGELLFGKGRPVPVSPRYSLLSYFLENGYRGVRLFFVISGFVLGLPFARQWLKREGRVSIRKYFLRRLSRLEPPYIASYAIAVILFGFLTRGSGITVRYLEHVAAGVTYLHSAIFQTLSPVNSVTWSLEVEIQFYILAPLFAFLYRIRSATLRRGFILFLIALCGALQAALMQHSDTAKLTIGFFAQYFLAGFLLADLYLLEFEGRSSRWWDAFGIVGWSAYFLVPYSAWAHALFPFLLLAVCASALCSVQLRFFYSNTIVAVIGGMCYSIYLLHYLLIASAFRLTRYLIFPRDYLVSLLIQVVATGVPVLLACTVFYALIERFFMDPNWPRRMRAWWYSRRNPPTEILPNDGL